MGDSAVIRSLLGGLRICLAGGLAMMAGGTGLAQAQSWTGLANDRIAVTYMPPVSDYYRATYEFMRKRRVLEELSAFLSPLRLPYTLNVTMMECGRTNAYYSKVDGVHLCYELPEYIMRIAPDDEAPDRFGREDVIVGTFVMLALHEVGHAVFEMLQVPILGREEDAADQIAAYVALNFGPKVARRVLGGSAQFWQLSDRSMSESAYADEHGIPLQRSYNLMCIAYGAQPGTFQYLVDMEMLPRDRADRCAREYAQAELAFRKTILPHIDPEALRIIQSVDWSQWDYPQ